MRKTASIAAVMCLAVIGAGGVADAASKGKPPKPRKHTRTLTLVYNPAGPTSHAMTGVGSVQGCVGAIANCLAFAPTKDEKYMTITAADALGGRVGVSLYPDTGGSGVSTETFICGSTKNLPIAPRSAWNLAADTVSADVACPGLASQGTVTIILSNLP